MTEFKQYHDGTETELKFHSQTCIYFCQCDAMHRLSFFELFRILSDAAVEDYNQRGMSWQMLYENNFGILLSRQSIRFHKMPMANQKITINTWEEKCQPLQFVRNFQIVDTETDEILVTGSSNWLLVNPNTHRILRLRDFTIRPESTIQTEPDCIPTGKIAVPEDITLLCSRPIWYSDVDGNGHMNNARYGAFVIDALPAEYQKKDFTDLRINYSKEAMVGQEIQLYGKFEDEEHKILIVGKQQDQICFECEVYWK